MRLLDNGSRYFIRCLILLLGFFTFSAPVFASETIEKPLLAWLPLLSSDLQLFQPDLHCPQNKIINIQLRKEIHSIAADIDAVNWNLNCQMAEFTNGRSDQALSVISQKESIAAQINRIIAYLNDFPATTLRIKTLYLHADMFDKPLIFSLAAEKKGAQLLITLTGKAFTLKLKIDLLSKQLTIDSRFVLQEVNKLLPLPDEFKKLLHRQLNITYRSDLNDWQKGSFSFDWQGSLPDLAEQAQMGGAGEVSWLTSQINLKAMRVNFSNVNYKISPHKEWRPSYIKFKLDKPAAIFFSPFQIKTFPLQLRVGASVLLTKVERGTSRRIRIDKQKLPPLFTSFNVQGGLHKISAAWRLSLLNQTLKGKLLYEQDKLNLQMEDASLAVQKLVAPLRRYFPDLQLLEISSGEIKLQLSACYHFSTQAAALKSRISGTSIAGKNGTLLFDGVTLNSLLDYQFAKKQLIINQDKQQLTIANLFVGVPLQALQLEAQANAGKVVITHFKARLLGGRVDFHDFPLQPPSHTAINISGLSLSEVIKYSAYPDIASKAIIDGVLPLSLTAGGPVIDNGEITARYPGGYIKVPENRVVNTMGRGNPAFSFTMQMLSNLQFDTLLGRFDYAADGESHLQIAIKGINPSVSGTQPITFNYSHNENILKLLESLRFNEQLIKQLEERY